MATSWLTKQAALAWAGQREWQKGESYGRTLTGLSAQPDDQRLLLRGRAHGQESYSVRVTLNGGVVEAALCSCPVGDAGRCKHVAALLNRAVTEPQAFAPWPDLRELLNGLGESELRRVIRLMLEREPDLMRILLTRVSSSAQGDARASGDLRRRIEAAFSLVEYDVEEDWEGEGPDLSDLAPLVEEVVKLLADMNILDAQGRVDAVDACVAVLSGLGELGLEDYDFDLREFVAPARTGLLKLLALPLEENTREIALDALQESVADLDWPDHEIKEYDQRTLFDALPAEDRQIISLFLKGLLDSRLPDYRKRSFASTLYALSAGGGNLSFEEEMKLAQTTGEVRDVLEVLFKHGRTEAAREELQSARRKPAPQEVEDLFAQHHLLPQLEDYARANLKVFGARAWLYQRFRESGRTAQAHALARDAVLNGTGDHEFYTSFFLRTDLNWLNELKAVSPNWPADRTEYLKKVWKSAALTDRLMRFLLAEGLLDDAQRLMKERPHLSPGLIAALAMRLSAEQAKPLLMKAAAAHVAGGSRTHYAQAAQTLSEGVALIGREEAQAIARLLLQDNPRLRALPEELKKVGLA